MYSFYVACAILGSTILILQFTLSIFGLSSEALDGDFGGDLDVDLPDDVHDGHSGDAHHHSGMTLAKVLTFKTIVAFITFFGLGGWWSIESQQGDVVTFSVAAAAGIGAMFLIAYLFQLLTKLEGRGNEQIREAVGCRGRVYLRIPAGGAGLGKATITAQGRTMELKASTPGPELQTGTNVQVSRVLDQQTVEVIALENEEEISHPA